MNAMLAIALFAVSVYSVNCACDRSSIQTCTNTYTEAIKGNTNNMPKLCAAVNTYQTCIRNTGCADDSSVKTIFDNIQKVLDEECVSVYSVNCACDRSSIQTCTNTYTEAIKGNTNNMPKLCAAVNTYQTCIRNTGCANDSSVKTIFDNIQKVLDEECVSVYSVNCACDRSSIQTCTNTYTEAIKGNTNNMPKLCAAVNTYQTCIRNTGCADDSSVKTIFDNIQKVLDEECGACQVQISLLCLAFVFISMMFYK